MTIIGGNRKSLNGLGGGLKNPMSLGKRYFISFNNKTPIMPSVSDGTITNQTTRERFYVRYTSKRISVLYINIGKPSTTTNSGCTLNLKCSIEYPSGTFRALTFKGALTKTILDGDSAITDEINDLDIPVGAFYWIRTNIQVNSGDKFYTSAGSTGNNEGIATGDLTTSGTIANTTGLGFFPIGVVGTNNNPEGSVFLNGNSISAGVGDATGGSILGYNISNRGFYGRAFAVSNPTAWSNVFANVAGDRVGFWNATFLSKLTPILQFCTHALYELGVNDLILAGSTNPLNTVQVNAIRVWDFYKASKLKAYCTTITPRTNSTDGWTTTANQTVTIYEANRVAYNEWVRDGAPINATTRAPLAKGSTSAIRIGQQGHPILGYYEFADQAETARNSGIFAPNTTVDGLHPSASIHINCSNLIIADLTTRFYR